MKHLLYLLPLTAQFLIAAPDYTLHEWGTFTTVSGSDGKLLPGLEREEEALPRSTYNLEGMPLGIGMTKGLATDRVLHNVTVKMETPVIYFYTPEAFQVQVEVGFQGGTISQWYPHRSASEQLPPIKKLPNGRVDPTSVVMDFAKPYTGNIQWKVEVIPPSENDAALLMRGDETPNWIYPRQTDSALVRTPAGETEKYLFYRGLGNFSLPVHFRTTADGKLTIQNDGTEAVPALFLFDSTKPNVIRTLQLPALQAGASTTIPLDKLKPMERKTWVQSVYLEMRGLLEAQGLYRKEAESMVNTWWHSYFQSPGLRAFWIVPNNEVTRILPLKVQPAPKQLVRVLVGRTEILTPEFEATLREDFAKAEREEKPNLWMNHRFASPYFARVQALKMAQASDSPKTATTKAQPK